MSTQEILTHLERMGWSTIYIDGTKLGPGRDTWLQSLQQLTPEQRATLEEKIDRFEARAKGRIAV